MSLKRSQILQWLCGIHNCAIRHETNGNLLRLQVLDIHDDVQDALKQPINDTDIDFEAELDELMSTENENTNSNQNNGNVQDSLDNIEEAFMNLKLPSVPKGSPKMEAI